MGKLSVHRSSVHSFVDPPRAFGQAKKEIADLKGIMAELAAKVEELEAAVAENESTRNALKAAFSRLAGAQNASVSGAGGSSSGVGAPGPSGVVNLGVVGRGSKRITLQPVSATGATAAERPAGARSSLPSPLCFRGYPCG